MKKKILKLLEEWKHLQPNMESSATREMLADDIIRVLFGDKTQSTGKTSTHNTDDIYHTFIDGTPVSHIKDNEGNK